MDSAVYERKNVSGLDAAEEKERQNRLRLAQYEALNRQNPDMQGWIRIEGTKVDYPVMYTPDEPEFYVDRKFDEENVLWNDFHRRGLPVDQSTPNILIYGHGVENIGICCRKSRITTAVNSKAHPYVDPRLAEQEPRR